MTILKVRRETDDGWYIVGTDEVTAGDGLTKHRTGEAVTLNVGAGTGIAVSADTVAAASPVVFTTRAIATGTGLTGGGDLSADRTLSAASPSVWISVAPATGQFVQWDGSKWITASASGAGDMLKSTYDPDGDGVMADAQISATITLLNITQITNRAHSDLAGIGASDHHVRYTDAEAIDAVEAATAATLAGAWVFLQNVAGTTFDGRDLSVDGAKLDGIESGAAADQTITAGTGLAGGGTGDVTLSAASPTVWLSAAPVTGRFIQWDGAKWVTTVAATHNLTTDIDHNQLTNYDANKHIDHTGVSVLGGNGLTGGGAITTTQTLAVGAGTGIAVSADAISAASPAVWVSAAPVTGRFVQWDGTKWVTTVAATHNLTTDIDHNQLTNTHNLTTDIDHDALTNFVADEHVAHATVTFSAGDGLTGGGTLAAHRTFAVGAGTGIGVTADTVYAASPTVFTTRSLTAGSWLTGGGTLAADRTLSLSAASLKLSDTGGGWKDEWRPLKVQGLEYEYIAPATWATVCHITDQGNMTHLWLALEVATPTTSGTLAWSHPLTIAVDGTTEVNTIVGNFFASTLGAPRWGADRIGCSKMDMTNSVASYYRYVSIPFDTSLTIKVKNASAAATLKVWGQVGWHDGKGSYGDRSQKFHCVSTATGASVAEYAAHIIGAASPLQAGRIEGFMLAVDGNNWQWMEGDIEIEIDGTKTIAYSGTEDAFLGSFYYGDVKWQTNYVGMTKQHTRTDDTPYYQSCFYRFLDLDQVPFEQSFQIKWYNGEAGQGAGAPGAINAGVWSEAWYYTEA